MTELELAQQFAAHLDHGDLPAWAQTLTYWQQEQVRWWIADWLAELPNPRIRGENLPASVRTILQESPHAG